MHATPRQATRALALLSARSICPSQREHGTTHSALFLGLRSIANCRTLTLRPLVRAVQCGVARASPLPHHATLHISSCYRTYHVHMSCACHTYATLGQPCCAVPCSLRGHRQPRACGRSGDSNVVDGRLPCLACQTRGAANATRASDAVCSHCAARGCSSSCSAPWCNALQTLRCCMRPCVDDVVDQATSSRPTRCSTATPRLLRLRARRPICRCGVLMLSSCSRAYWRRCPSSSKSL